MENFETDLPVGWGFDVLRPEIPSDLVLHDDGRWECSAASLAKLQRWCRRFGVDLDVCCPHEDLSEQLHYMLRAAAMLPHLDNPRKAPAVGTPYWRYLKAVLAGEPVDAGAVKETIIVISRSKSRYGPRRYQAEGSPRR